MLDDDETMTVYCLTAREDGRAGRMDYLIAKKAINISTAFLVRAVLHGNSETLDSILATGIDVNTRTDENISPLMAAILFAKKAYAVQALLDHGANVDAIVEIDSDKRSVPELCMALPEGDGQTLDALIDGGASVVRKDGSNIVFQACTVPAKINGAHVLRHLLEKHPLLRAFVNVECNHYTPIHAASFVGNLEAVTILLEYGAEVDSTLPFNPITTAEHLARSPEDRYVPFERDGFNSERWKLTAETVSMKLLDESDPGHGRNQLHVATSICNYDPVVELVERGLQPWRGDSKKVTPVGLLPKEVFEYDDTQDSDPQKDFIVQGSKIKDYLEHQMVEWASQNKTFDLMDDPPLPRAPELDSPFQLETRLRDERWAEAEDLLSLIIRQRQNPEHDESSEIDEVRSSLIATLIAVNRFEEARGLVDKSLAGAISKALCCEEPLEISSYDGLASEPNIPDTTPIIEEEEVVVPLFPTLAAIGDTLALDRFIKVCANTEDAGLALTIFDLCFVRWKCDESFKGTELMSHALETIRTGERCSKPLYIRLAGELICRYCGLERWEEAEKELQFFLGTLDVFEAERFPPTYNMLLRVVEVLKSYSKWTEAENIYRKLYSYTLGSRSQTSYYSTNTLRLVVNLFEVQSNYKEAGESESQLLKTNQQIFGLESVETQWRKLELARIYEKAGRLVECVILQRQALQVFESFGHEQRQNTLAAKTQLCRALTRQQVLDEAESLAREIVAECSNLHGNSGSETLTAMNDLALVLNNQERCEEAIVLYKEILKIQEEIFGEVHESTRYAMTELLPTYIRANMLDEAEALGKRLVKVSETLYGPEGMVTLHVLFYLSGVYRKSGQLEKSRDMKMQVLALERKLRSPGHKETLYTMTELAHCHYVLGEIDEAIALQTEALDGYRQLDGDNAMKTMENIFDLACSYHEAAKLEDARLQSLLGDQDEKTINKLAPLMALYTEIDEYELAKNLAYESLWFMEKAHGDDYSLTQEARRSVIIVTTSLEKWRDAEGQAKKLLTSLERTHGIDHADAIDMANRLAECLQERREFTAAEPLYNRVLQSKRTHLPPDNDSTLEVMTSLIFTLRKLSRFFEAATLNQELLDIHTRTLGPTHATTLAITAIKANILYAQKRYPEAAAFEIDILATRTAILGPSNAETLEAKENLAHTYLKQKRYDDAATLAEDVLHVREEEGTEDTDEDMLSTIEILKDIYIAAQRWNDARKIVDRELMARQVGTKEMGDAAVFAALEILKIVARGQGDEGEVREVQEM
ncbi:MAG: hypothetical protein Q9192_005824, partial [Flavoplaca navasiana]